MSALSKPCSLCGIEKPATEFYANAKNSTGLSSWCKPCTAIKQAAYMATPEGRAKGSARTRKSERRRKLLRHGVPLERVPVLIAEAENGQCHACGKRPSELDIPNPSAARLHVDHDHKTNRYRGLLCQKCNSALGLVDDNVEVLMALAAYLLKQQDLMLLGGQA